MKLPEVVYDVIGVGFGPANVALAIAIEEAGQHLNALFLEERSEPAWQPGMLFEGSDIQNHPLRDLVTPRNPRSKYTFTNFLHENGRLFEHLNLGLLMPMRVEYAQYINWVARHFDRCVRYGNRVVRIEPACIGNGVADGYQVWTTQGESYIARALVLAPGRTPYVPAVFQSVMGDRVIHLNDYLKALDRLAKHHSLRRVAVVGGSQSAVEIMLHLSKFLPHTDVVGFIRRFGYRLKDTSPFTGEVYFPEFVRLFYHADQETKDRLRSDLHLTNYSAADGDVLDALYRTIYQQKIVGQQRIFVRRGAEIRRVARVNDRLSIDFSRCEGQGTEREEFDLIVLATGFRDLGTSEHQERYPPLFTSLLPYAKTQGDGCIQIGYDYRVDMDKQLIGAPCFVNGLCESTHGMGDAGSFSLLSLRAQQIYDALTRSIKESSREPVGSRYRHAQLA